MSFYLKIFGILSLLITLPLQSMEYYEQDPQKVAMLKERGVGAVYNWIYPNGSYQRFRVVFIVNGRDGKLTIGMDPVDNIIICNFENENDFTYKKVELSQSGLGGGDWTKGLGSGMVSGVAEGIVADSGLQDQINKAYQRIAELQKQMGEDFKKVEEAKINLQNAAVVLKFKVNAILKSGIKPLELPSDAVSKIKIVLDEGLAPVKNIKFLSKDNNFLSQAEKIRNILGQAKIKDSIDQSFFDVSKSSLIEADQQSFLGHKDESENLLKMAKASADVLIGFDPFTGFARGVYETFTGKNLITDELLSPTERTLALLGAFGGGMAVAKIAKSASIIADIIGHLTKISDASKKIFILTQHILNAAKSFENDWRWILKTPEQIISDGKSILKPTQEFLNPKIIDQKISELIAGKGIKPIEVIRTPSGKYILDGHHTYIASKITGIKVPEIVTEAGDLKGLPDWKNVTFYDFKLE